MPFKSIHKFTEINQFHHAAQGGLHSKSDDVHVFRFSDICMGVVTEMPLFRTTFYQIGLMRQANFKMSVYENEYTLENLFALVFFKPGQLIRFASDPNWDGYVIHFKTAFISIPNDNLEALKRFSILDPSRESFLIIQESDFKELAEVYEKMLYEYEKPLLSNLSIIELYLQILFHKVNDIFERDNLPKETFSTRKEQISFHFKKLVSEKLRETKTINDFADMLFVTPKYLIEALKETIGASPKEYVDNRIIAETKTLLRYTNQSIYDIAMAYQFRDQAHFSNFFRQQTSMTPLEYRKALA
jgi:AraC-like DNA-binding protein